MTEEATKLHVEMKPLKVYSVTPEEMAELPVKSHPLCKRLQLPLRCPGCENINAVECIVRDLFEDDEDTISQIYQDRCPKCKGVMSWQVKITAFEVHVVLDREVKEE